MLTKDDTVPYSYWNLSTESACGPSLLVNPVRDTTNQELRVQRIYSLIKHTKKEGNKIRK